MSKGQSPNGYFSEVRLAAALEGKSPHHADEQPRQRVAFGLAEREMLGVLTGKLIEGAYLAGRSKALGLTTLR